METVNISLVFFGSLKGFFGNQSDISVPRGTNLGILLKILKDKAPDATEILNSCRIAINSEFETIDFTIVQPGEIAILPPFSGG
jgi:molybdopterin converting factor small subunit